MYSTTHSATIACDWIFNVLSRSRLKAMAGNDEIDETRFYSAWSIDLNTLWGEGHFFKK